MSHSRPTIIRTCPWCADATVVALSEEGVVRALARHLEHCPGEPDAEQP
jgi:hypothetical protein